MTLRAPSRTESPSHRGFTLIETMVAITLLSFAIVTPMTLVAQALSAAYYARDQVTAYSLGQEGIEAVRSVRDGNILANALNNSGLDLLNGIPQNGVQFTVDATKSTAAAAIQQCSTSPCPPLQTDGTLYGYNSGWTNTQFTRTLTAVYVGPSTINSGRDIIRVTAVVSWKTPNAQTRSVTIYENMYRWVNDGSAGH